MKQYFNFKVGLGPATVYLLYFHIFYDVKMYLVQSEYNPYK